MYHFVTHWFFEAPIERVWNELEDLEAWPSWWSSYRKAKKITPEPRLQVGSRAECEVKGKLPYTLSFTTEVASLQAPTLMEVKSSKGIEGTGKFVLEQKDNGTAVTYYWDVRAANPILDSLGNLSFLRKQMEENHNYVMEVGYRGLKQRLESKKEPEPASQVAYTPA
jgi:uncharacterized protein YndB with AHSA1/START domain